MLIFNRQIAAMPLRLHHSFQLILFTIFHFTAAAQRFNPYFNFRQLNVDNGLSQDIVYHFLQDSRGYMWMGTRNGLTEYDGIRSVNFQHDELNKKTISGNFITRILEDSGHQIWIGTNAGIDRYNRIDNSFTHFAIPSAEGHPEDNYCALLGFSNGYDLWFLDTKWKAIRIFDTRSKKFRLSVPTDAVDGVLLADPVSKRVQIWSYLSIGTTCYTFQNDSLIGKSHFFYNGKDDKWPPLQVFHVLPQNDTVIWLSTAKGLIELNPLIPTYKIYNSMGTEPVTEIRSAALSPKGLLWLSTGGFGIYTFDVQAKKFVDNFRNYFSDPFSICSNNIVSLYFDRAGNIWCGSFGSGVSYANVENRFFSKDLSKIELDPWKKENNVYWISQDHDGNFWCILQDVLAFWMLDSNLHVKEFRQPLLDNGRPFRGSLYQIFFDWKNTAWCLTDRGLYRYNTRTNRMSLLEYLRFSGELFGSYWINNMIALHDSSLLFSTMSGLYRTYFKNGETTILPFSELNEKPFKSFDIIYEDKERNIFVKDIAENLYVLSPTGINNRYILKKQIDFPETIIQFSEDSADIYLASSHGLFLLHKKNLTIEKSPISNSIPFAKLNNILVGKNKVWIFGEKGMYCYNSAEKSGRLFTTEDGLPSDKFSEYCLVITASGKCICGTSNGLVSFYPEKLKDIIYPPRAQLISMYVNDSVKSFIANPQESSGVSLEHDQNTFSFDFSCISFQHAAANTYEYKLESFDENWIKAGNSHYTRYSKIPPGKYNFQLRTLDAKGVVSPFTKTLAIEIKKAFWQTLFFKILVGVVFSFLIWRLIKWYFNIKIRKQQRKFEKQQAIEKERTRIATDMHDDLGAGLSSIRFLSEKVRRNSFSDITKNDINKIMEHSSELIDKMNEIVWAMNEKNDSLGDLLVHIRSYAKEYCEENGIRCEISLPEYIPVVFVSGEMRRNVFLTIKECLHNIIKHAGATEARIEIVVDPGLSVTIRDNGKGIIDSENKKETGGNGLKNMQKRINSIGGRFRIIQGQGLAVEIAVPLHM
jgi:signal transduction histidine kinase/ligand-binding sensor domain-containing protein